MFEEFKLILNEFWLLDCSEYILLKNLMIEEIKRLDKEVSEDKSDESVYSDEVIKQYYTDKQLRDFYIVMKEKVEYIISKGLCKK